MEKQGKGRERERRGRYEAEGTYGERRRDIGEELLREWRMKKGTGMGGRIMRRRGAGVGTRKEGVGVGRELNGYDNEGKYERCCAYNIICLVSFLYYSRIFSSSAVLAMQSYHVDKEETQETHMKS